MIAIRVAILVVIILATIAITTTTSAKDSCSKRYTISQYQQYVRKYYKHGNIAKRFIHQLHQMERCQVNGQRARDYAVRWRQQFIYNQRQAYLDSQMPTAIASNYDDSGQTASGSHFQYGFAHRESMAMYTKVRFCYNGCQTGIMDDHGPYIAGREFDLNPALRDAIHCPDLCKVRWRIVH